MAASEARGGSRRSGPGLSNLTVLIGLVVIVLAGFGAADPRYLALANLASIGQQTAVIAIVAFAMTAVIVARGIDISVGSTLALSGILAAHAYQFTGSTTATLVVALAGGGAIGLLNGLLVSGIGISPFVATLATMAFARGTALSLSQASSIPIADPVLLWAGSGQVAGVPAALIVALTLFLLWWFLLERTVFGRWVYAIGGNPEAARASLIPVAFVQTATFVLAGMSAGLGAIIVIGRLGSAQPLAGMGLEFTVITAAIVGGTKLSGGEGSVIGTILGAVLLGCINTGLSFLQVPQQIIYVITGGLMLFAVLLSQRETLFAARAWARGRRDRRDAPAARPDPASRGTAEHELRITGLGKDFPGVVALDDITFAIRSGEVVALAGENGAGKSTLVKCLTGVYQPDRGTIVIDGGEARFRSPAEARGIAVIHQHFSLVPDLTVAENVFLGREPRNAFGLLDRARMRRETRALMQSLGLDIAPDAPLGLLTIGQRQMVEIAKSMLGEAWLVIMDEPTSALTNRERDHLYGLIGTLTARGCAILYISHKMEEIFTLASRAVVLRDGRLVGDRPIAALDERVLIEMMVGRDVANVFPWRRADRGEVAVVVDGISDGGLLREASLELRAGEVVVLAGLMGSGRSEVLRCIAGLARHDSGRIRIGAADLPPGDARTANALGVAYIPEDRHLEGFVGAMSVNDNLTLAWMRDHNRLGIVSRRATMALSRQLIAALGVRPQDPLKRTADLSGGNQQKVVIGKWLATAPRVLLLDEPTRGVDVGAKSELHGLIAGLKEKGAAILMVSSELPEVLGVADRILVMHEGRLVGELPRGAEERAVMALAFGRAPEMETRSGVV